MENKKKTAIRRSAHGELAVSYGLSWKTFQKRIKPYENEIGEKVGNYYTPKQVLTIVSKLGPPLVALKPLNQVRQSPGRQYRRKEASAR